MKRDNWRFEALARAQIARQEKEAKVIKNVPDIEDFKPAEEIERLQNINAELLEVCKEIAEGLQRDIRNYPDGHFPSSERFTNRANRLLQAIAKAEGNL